MWEPEHEVPADRQLEVSTTIEREGRAIGMELVSVHLDDDPAFHPNEIDQVSVLIPRGDRDVEPEEPGEHLVLRMRLAQLLAAG